MNEALVNSAVSWWSRRVGPRPVFDRDDALQEARIAAWQADKAGQPVMQGRLYRRILDGVRRAIPGFRGRTAPAMLGESQVPEGWHEDTPDKALLAKEYLARIEALPDRERDVAKAIMAGATCREVGEQLGVSEVYAGRLLQMACRRLVKGHGIDAREWSAPPKEAREPVVDTSVTQAQRAEAAKAAALFNEAMEA